MMRDEIFGPILPVYGYDELQPVIDKINSRPKPLTVYLFSEDKAVREKVKLETSAGAFVVNDVAIHLINHALPFGGVGMSGYGRYHGKCGFDAVSNPKSVVEAKILDVWPVTLRFPPYTPQKEKSMTWLMTKLGGTTPGQLLRYLLILVVAVLLFTQGRKYL